MPLIYTPPLVVFFPANIMGQSGSTGRAGLNAQRDEVSEAALAAMAGGEEADSLRSRVELSLSCLDVRKKCSTRVFAYQKLSGEDRTQWELTGSTEVHPESSNPSYIRSVVVDFRFEVSQRMRFELYNVINPQHAQLPDRQELLGLCECTLGEIVASRRVRKALQHPSKGASGYVEVVAEEMSRLRNLVSFTLRCSDLPIKNPLTRSCHPYAVVYRGLDRQFKKERKVEPQGVEEGGGEDDSDAGFDDSENPLWGLPIKKIGRSEPSAVAQETTAVPVLRTEVIRRTRRPTWERVELSVQQLCRGNSKRPILIEIWSWTRSDVHVFVGSCSTTYSDLCRAFEMGRPIVRTLESI